MLHCVCFHGPHCVHLVHAADQAPSRGRLPERLHPGTHHASLHQPVVTPPCSSLFFVIHQDGFPRTTAQAEYLETVRLVGRERVVCASASHRRGEQVAHIDKVVNFVLPDHVLVQKLTGRRVCETCGRNYNIAAIHEGVSCSFSSGCVPDTHMYAHTQARWTCRHFCRRRETVTLATTTHPLCSERMILKRSSPTVWISTRRKPTLWWSSTRARVRWCSACVAVLVSCDP